MLTANPDPSEHISEAQAVIRTGHLFGNHVVSRRSKTVLVIVAALVVVFAAVVLGVNFLVSRQDHELIRQQIIAHFETSTGLKLQIGGPLELPYSLLPTVVFHDVVLSNPAVETGRKLLVAKVLRVTIEVLPLLRDEVLIHNSSLSSVELNLEVDEDGNANWISEAAGTTAPAQIAIQSIDVSNISLSYRNLLSGLTISDHVNELRLDRPVRHGPVAMKLSAEHNGVNMTITGHVDRFEAGEPTGLRLRLEADGNNLRELAGLIGIPVPETNSFSLAATLSTLDGALSASDIAGEIDWQDSRLVIGGNVQDVRAWGGLDLIASVSGDDLSDISLLQQGTSLPHTDSYVFSGEVRGDWPSLSVTQLTASMTREKLTINLAGNTDNIAELSGIDLTLIASGTDLASVPELSPLELPMTDFFEIEGRLIGSVSQISLTELKSVARRGQHRMELSGDIDDVASFGGIGAQFVAVGSDLSELNEIFTLNLPVTQNYRVSAALAGNGHNLSARNVVIEGVAAGLRLDMSGGIGRIFELQDVNLETLIAIDDFSSLGPYFGTNLPQSEPIDLHGHLTGSAPDLTLEELSGRSGHTQVSGSVRLQTDERVGITGSVTSGVIDMRHYLMAARENSEARTTSTGDRIFSDEPFDLGILDFADVQLAVENLELTLLAGNLFVQQATLSSQQGNLTIEPMELTRGDSVIRGNFRLDRQTQPEFDVDLSIENIDLNSFLDDLGIRQNYEGTFDLAANVQSRGNSVRQILANIDGKITGIVGQARIPEASVSLRTPNLILNLLPRIKRRADLDVECGISQLDLKDGVIDVGVLYLDAEQMNVIGDGTIDLRAETLDLRLSPRPTRSRILAHNMDIIVTGPLSEPEVSNVGAAKAVAADVGKYALFGPPGLLLPTERSRSHPCVGSLQEYRRQQTTED